MKNSVWNNVEDQFKKKTIKVSRKTDAGLNTTISAVQLIEYLQTFTSQYSIEMNLCEFIVRRIIHHSCAFGDLFKCPVTVFAQLYSGDCYQQKLIHKEMNNFHNVRR